MRRLLVLFAFAASPAYAQPTVKQGLERVCSIYTEELKAHPSSMLDAHRAIVKKGKKIVEKVLEARAKGDFTKVKVAVDEAAGKEWNRRIIETWANVVVSFPADHGGMWNQLAKIDKIEWSCPAIAQHDAAAKSEYGKEPGKWHQ